jgi:thioredoxin-related protein
MKRMQALDSFDRLSKRKFFKNSSIALVCAISFINPLQTFAQTAQRMLPESKSLASEIAQSLKSAQPLVVLVSLDNCAFCRISRENYLIPLLREQSQQVVQVNMGYTTSIVDALGQRTTQADLIRRWNITAAPTVLFLGKNGKELAPRLVGGSTSDFYGAYLQERIDQASKSLRVN